MNKLIFSIIFGVFLIYSVNALTYNLTAGKSQSFDLGEEFSYYSIVGNSTPVNLNISQEGTIVTIIPDKYSPNDAFEIIFFNEKKEVIHEGGGRKIIYKDRNITKEIPTYINKSIPVEVIKEVDNTEKINALEKEIKLYQYLLVGLGVLFILAVSFLIKKTIKLKQEVKNE